jgi:1-piperideine-2-carboxylate/1-pyrroline-2-carboxylate reductase [NAD(P)H]
MKPWSPSIFDAPATAAALPYPALALAVEDVLRDPAVAVPPRMVLPMGQGNSLFVMPAHDARIAITKIITVLPSNRQRGLPPVQGDILVFDIQTGQRIAVLDGPTVTARRTAAVSLLAAQKLSPGLRGPMLIVGAGDQGRAHLEAFHTGMGVQEVFVHSRSAASANALVAYAQSLGLKAHQVSDPNAAVLDSAWVMTTTPALEVVMTTAPAPGTFVSAVGAFTPHMAEWSAPVCQALSLAATLVVDTRDADHEAGDLLQAGIDVAALPTLGDVVTLSAGQTLGPVSGQTVFFKNCGWAGWDLAAARCAVARLLA